MKVLLDTHAFLWAITDDARMPPRVRKTIAASDCFFSAASIWEVIVKVQAGKMSLPRPVGPFLVSELMSSGVQILPVTLEHVLRVESLHSHHRDPFDRILIAQSLVEDFPVVTSDPLFKKYPAGVTW
ncbi:MAG TPA: type II toxin-antitoxin system VapC family toxin [Candidatus Sulfotelmatobacter sp.]